MILRILLLGTDQTFGQELHQHLETLKQVVVLRGMRDPANAVSSIGREKPEVVIVEIPGWEGADKTFDVIAKVLQVAPGSSVVAAGPANSAELVIRAIRAGAIEFLGRPVSPQDLAAAIEKIRRLHRAATGSDGKIGQVISVYATKGGLGVTTLATNLAVCLAQKAPDDVLLVDLDVHQGSVATLLNLKTTYSVQDVFGQTHRLDEAYLRSLLLRHSSALCVLPAPPTLEQAQFTPSQMVTGLEVVRSHFAHVVLDLPRDVRPGTIATLEQSDQILYVVGLNVPALRATVNGLATIRSLGIDMRKVRLVVSRADARDEVSLNRAREALGMPIFWRAPNDYPTVVSSINDGTPFVLVSPRAEIAKNMQRLSEAVARVATADTKGKGWLPSVTRRVFTPAV